jgi:hypothetical protein
MRNHIHLINNIDIRSSVKEKNDNLVVTVAASQMQWSESFLKMVRKRAVDRRPYSFWRDWHHDSEGI